MLSASLCCILTVPTIHFLSNNQASCKLHYVSSFHYEDYPSVRWQMHLPPKATCHGFKYGNQPLHKLESSAAYESVLLYPAKAKALRIGKWLLCAHEVGPWATGKPDSELCTLISDLQSNVVQLALHTSGAMFLQIVQL
ncbi:uncharacterized protein LOC126733246 isoform X2 [Quercus robur]|uniref:uncharacterized protein LOC126733246 isoform X2 n=1 Tax=Quercus robur TaxID=38942 RepID=UPI002163663E|nr:uncharacterized protein LOC126733246 isoform X2 [Quercus robur]